MFRSTKETRSLLLQDVSKIVMKLKVLQELWIKVDKKPVSALL